MTEITPPISELAVRDEQDPHLTYFAYAKVNQADADHVPAKAEFETVPKVLAGRYRIERLLGIGGMGMVYRARDLLREQFGDPDPYIAIKMLSLELNNSPDASALLYGEFALTNYLRHDNVVRQHTFEVDTDCQRAFITMELMHGLTLDKVLCMRPEGLRWEELRDIVLPLLDALTHSHARGVLHGDMKPSNVMVGEDGVRLFDFGLGLGREAVLPGLPRLNRSRFKAWTRGYAAPEIIEGKPLTACADLYGVACVIYELASGRHPFRQFSSDNARDGQVARRVSEPANLPKRCWPALKTALALDVKERTITAQQLRDAFNGPSYWWQRLRRLHNG